MKKVIYFAGSMCPPCKHFWNTTIKPQVADIYPGRVEHIVDDYNVAKKYHIKYTPTIILVNDNGEEEKRFVGCSKAAVGEIIDFLET